MLPTMKFPCRHRDTGGAHDANAAKNDGSMPQKWQCLSQDMELLRQYSSIPHSSGHQNCGLFSGTKILSDRRWLKISITQLMSAFALKKVTCSNFDFLSPYAHCQG